MATYLPPNEGSESILRQEASPQNNPIFAKRPTEAASYTADRFQVPVHRSRQKSLL